MAENFDQMLYGNDASSPAPKMAANSVAENSHTRMVDSSLQLIEDSCQPTYIESASNWILGLFRGESGTAVSERQIKDCLDETGYFERLTFASRDFKSSHPAYMHTPEHVKAAAVTDNGSIEFKP